MNGLSCGARRLGRCLVLIAWVGLLSACGSNELPAFEKAAAEATDDLVAQTSRLPPFLARIESMVFGPDKKAARRAIVLDPMLDTITGQQTETTQLFERRVTQRMGLKYPQFEFLPFQAANLPRAQYLMTGTLSRVGADVEKASVRLSLAITDLKTGLVVAQASALARQQNLDATPSRYYKDAPILIRDQVADGYAKTSMATPGQRADPDYMAQLAAAPVITQATTLYNAERYQDALGEYKSALATPAGEQMRVQSGIYLTNLKLGRTAEAEQAFGRIVSLGIATNQLGVKFLFNPGGVDFWSDSKISSAYPMWLRQIAREVAATGRCVKVVGHTSRSGPAPANVALSLKRAVYVKQRLAAEQPSLGVRTEAEGVGFRENIVGSGTDNGFDVLDRRVEFKISRCPEGAARP